jgi:hypothetical protein
MDVEIDVALGGGTEEQKVAVLSSIAQKQEQILQTMGPQNQLVTPSQYRNTLVRIVQASGYKNADEFFSNPAMMPPPPQPPPPPPDPAMILAEVERQKIMADIQIKQAELELKRQQMLLEDDRARDKQESELMLRAYEIQLKSGTAVDVESIKMMMAEPRTASPSVQRPVIPEITPFEPIPQMPMQQMQPPQMQPPQMQPPPPDMM